MDKKIEALKRLDALDKEAKELRKIIEDPTTLFEQIKNYSDVCKKLDIEELDENDFKFLPKEKRAKQLSYHKIQNIATLFNGSWKPDWNISNQSKYYPYFQNKVGVGLVFDCSSYGYCSCSGAVSFYKDEETSNFIGKTFVDIYRVLAD